MAIERVPSGGDKLPLQHEVDAPGYPAEGPANPLESAEAIQELRTCEDWYQESSDSLAECFSEMAIDHDYYDHLQWTEEERAELMARGQAALVFNKTAMTVDWLTGTERRTRIDFSVQPKEKSAAETAQVKAKLLKYQSDTNMIGWNRSRAFKDAVIGGVGWTESSIRGDQAQELVYHGYVPWQHLKWDPFSRSLDLDDCRYIHRRKWIDLDFAIAMFPGAEDVLRGASRSHLFGDEEWGQDQLDLPQVFRRYDSRGAEIVQRRWTGAVPITGSSCRLRVPITESWFRQPRRVKKFYGLAGQGLEFDPNNAEMAEAVTKGYATLSDAINQDIRLCTWVPGHVLYRGLSPFRHGSFPFTPIWAKRRDKDGAPYGVIRGIRDAQDDFNKRLSKAQWLLATNQLLYETEAIDEDRKAEIQRNLAKPNGMVEFKTGALSKGMIKIERNVELADAQTKLLEISAAHIHDGSGVNRELLGRETNAVSGRAIHAKQDEGSVTTAEFFDNLRLHVQLDGKKQLSLNEQFLTLPMQIRIAGDEATKAIDWLEINQPELQADNTWSLKNDITKADAVFVVDQVDFRASIRAAQAEQFGEMLKSMPPELQMALVDIFVEMTDIPHREEAVKRIRAITGHGRVDDQDPAAAAMRQKQEAAQEQERALAMRERLAKAGLDEAKSQEVMAKARKLAVEGKGSALQIAELIEALLPLVPSADRLYRTPEESNAAAPVPAQ
jgi:hypothetical protein